MAMIATEEDSPATMSPLSTPRADRAEAMIATPSLN